MLCTGQRRDGTRWKVARSGHRVGCVGSGRRLHDPLGAWARTDWATDGRLQSSRTVRPQAVASLVAGGQPRFGASWARRGTWTTESEPWQKPDFRKQLGMVGGIIGKRAVARRASGRNPHWTRNVARAYPNAAVPIRNDVASRARVAGSGGRRCGDGQRGFADLAGSCLPEGGIES